MARLKRKEFSAGGVVYKKEGDSVKIILISRSHSLGAQVWCLPKGKIESNETHINAAAREIKEETGASGNLVKLLGDIKYQFISPQDKAHVYKEVRFFLFEYTNGILRAQENESLDAKWFDIDEAARIMAYPSEKSMVLKAKGEIG